jgi:hypothetical protein
LIISIWVSKFPFATFFPIEPISFVHQSIWSSQYSIPLLDTIFPSTFIDITIIKRYLDLSSPQWIGPEVLIGNNQNYY